MKVHKTIQKYNYNKKGKLIRVKKHKRTYNKRKRIRRYVYPWDWTPYKTEKLAKIEEIGKQEYKKDPEEWREKRGRLYIPREKVFE